MPKIPATEYKNLQSGLICEGAVGEFRMPTDAVTESINFHFDRIGSATLRPGTTQLGDALSGNILGLYEFRDSGSGSNNQITMVNGTDFYYLSGSTWTSRRSGLTASAKARFTTFLDFLWMVNGVDATAIWNGAGASAFVTNGNASGAPVGSFIENFRSRVWIAGNSTYPDRLYFSSLPSAVATPVVTWDTDVSTGDWIDISPSDGENITALKRAKNQLLVFKQNHIYRVASITETEPDPAIFVGTYSQESVVKAKDGGIYFHHPSGFYRYEGGQAKEISKPIQDIVDAISAANYTKIAGWEDGDHLYWSVGNVTIRGVTYNNLVVRHTISSEAWTHYSYPYQFLNSAKYNDGTTLFVLAGNTNGEVMKINVGSDDDGTPIYYSIVHRWQNIDGFNSTRKSITKMIALHEQGAGANMTWQKEGDQTSDWSKPVGQLKEYNTGFSARDIKGRKIRFRVAGVSSGVPFTYNGFEILEGMTEFVQFA